MTAQKQEPKPEPKPEPKQEPTDQPVQLRRSSLVAIRPEPRFALKKANIVLNPDGRIQLNTIAMDSLGTKKNPAKAIRLFMDTSRRYLVVQRAEPDHPDALRIFPVGRQSDQWPQVHVARSARLAREIGIEERTRIILEFDEKQRWWVADTQDATPLGPSSGGPTVEAILSSWVKTAKVNAPMRPREFYRGVCEIARRMNRRPPLLLRQVLLYMENHSEELAQKHGLKVLPDHRIMVESKR